MAENANISFADLLIEASHNWQKSSMPSNVPGSIWQIAAQTISSGRSSDNALADTSLQKWFQSYFLDRAGSGEVLGYSLTRICGEFEQRFADPHRHVAPLARLAL